MCRPTKYTHKGSGQDFLKQQLICLTMIFVVLLHIVSWNGQLVDYTSRGVGLLFLSMAVVVDFKIICESSNSKENNITLLN